MSTPVANKDDINLVLYHKSCKDGFAASTVAWMYLGDKAEYQAISYGEPAPDVTGKHVAIVDFSFKRAEMLAVIQQAASIIVLDHHKTAKEELEGIPQATFDMEKSGAVLAWEFFYPDEKVPMALKLIQDRDLWKWEFKITRAFSMGLEMVPFDHETYSKIFQNRDDFDAVYSQGFHILEYQKFMVDKLAKRAAIGVVNGVRMWVLNCMPDWSSELGEALYSREDDVGVALIWYFNNKTRHIHCSLRSRRGIDISPIATHFGGGGHPNAAGFAWEGSIESLVAFEDANSETQT